MVCLCLLIANSVYQHLTKILECTLQYTRALKPYQKNIDFIVASIFVHM